MANRTITQESFWKDPLTNDRKILDQDTIIFSDLGVAYHPIVGVSKAMTYFCDVYNPREWEKDRCPNGVAMTYQNILRLARRHKRAVDLTWLREHASDISLWYFSPDPDSHYLQVTSKMHGFGSEDDTEEYGRLYFAEIDEFNSFLRELEPVCPVLYIPSAKKSFALIADLAFWSGDDADTTEDLSVCSPPENTDHFEPPEDDPHSVKCTQIYPTMGD